MTAPDSQPILFENLFKPRQRRLAVYICYWLRQFYRQPQSSALSNLRLVCSLIFIEYKVQEDNFLKKQK